MYKTGVENSALNILDELGSKASIKVKPPVGIGDDNEIDDTIMQGESISSILCSNSVDTIAKNCPLKPLQIRDSISIPQMSFVDDVIDANKCGRETQMMNEYTNNEFSRRRLQLGFDKCVRMHVSANKNLKNTKSKCGDVYIDEWVTKAQLSTD